MDEKDSIITFERLYELLRLEKYNKELQNLDHNFFTHVTNYINEKKTTLSTHGSKNSIFAAQSILKTQKQLENIHKILQELYERRESKIMQLAIFSARTNTPLTEQNMMLAQEKELYNDLSTAFTTHRTLILTALLEGKNPAADEAKGIKDDEKPTDHRVVRFLEAVPQFVGEDMHVYGPYKTEDVATLPAKVGAVLIKNKHAQEL